MIKRRGYTLIEVVLVIVLISILAVGTAIGYNFYVRKAKDAGVDANLKSINITIDYLQDRKGRLPNIEEVRREMGEHGYKFNLSHALISNVDGVQYLTIRAETTQLSKYNIPYSINIVAVYNNEFGPKMDGDTIDIRANEKELLNFNPSSISMIILDNTPSGVPEIFWVN